MIKSACVALLALLLTFPVVSLSQDRGTIAVIGTGDMGDSLGPKFAELGYRVVYGSRDPTREALKKLVQQTGNGARATTQQEAAQAGDIVVLAVRWPAMETVAKNLGKLDGKLIIDISTPFRQAEDGYMESMVETSSAELIQGWNPGAIVVKTVTASSNIIDDPEVLDGPVATFVAADDRAAKEQVARLVAELGMVPVDAGPLRHSREIEAFFHLFMVPLLQQRGQSWEMAIRPNNIWACIAEDDWYSPVADKGNLAQLPDPGIELPPCP